MGLMSELRKDKNFKIGMDVLSEDKTLEVTH
ncbi:MAG: hypothetical protein ACJA0H_001599 [Francisellaceae bacterium]|jgi:hypothetical protein